MRQDKKLLFCDFIAIGPFPKVFIKKILLRSFNKTEEFLFSMVLYCFVDYFTPCFSLKKVMIQMFKLMDEPLCYLTEIKARPNEN